MYGGESCVENGKKLDELEHEKAFVSELFFMRGKVLNYTPKITGMTNGLFAVF